MAKNTQFVDIMGGTSELLVDTMSDIMGGFGAVMTSLACIVHRWQTRAEERRHLASLSFDERLMEDMGMTRADALREAGKPFWMS